MDTETTGLNVWSPKVRTTHVSWFDNSGRGDAYEVGNHDDKILELQRRCNEPDTTVLFFNAKFDIAMLNKIGFNISNPIIDVLLVAQLTKGGDKCRKLKQLVRKYLNDPFLEDVAMRKWLRENKGKVQGEAPRHIVIPYAMADAKRTLELFHYLMAGLDDMSLWPVLEREMALMPVVYKMENFGVKVNLDTVAKLEQDTIAELKQLKDRIVLITGNKSFNPNSARQVVNAVYNGDVMPTNFSRKTGQPKVDELALLQCPSEIGSLIVRFRKIQKAKTTYLKHLKNLDSENVLRVHFNQGGARTGRFSSSGPNLQNIPRPDKSALGSIRDCFIPREGNRLLFVDYKQIELRLTAHFSGQKHMLKAIKEGQDLHGVTCAMLFDKKETDSDWDIYRYLAKTLNFAIVYGTGPQKFMETVLKDTDGKVRISLMEASNYINEYKSRHDKIEALFTKVIDEVSKTGGIANAYGRFMPVDMYKAYAGVNYLIQGTAADFLKMKMLVVTNALKLMGAKTKLIMTIHDELVFDLYPDEKYIIPALKDLMEDHTTFKVPLQVSMKLGKTWMQTKEIKTQLVTC